MVFFNFAFYLQMDIDDGVSFNPDIGRIIFGNRWSHHKQIGLGT